MPIPTPIRKKGCRKTDFRRITEKDGRRTTFLYLGGDAHFRSRPGIFYVKQALYGSGFRLLRSVSAFSARCPISAGGPFGKNRAESDAKLQGAGSIKRDFAIWRDFAADEGLVFQGVSLQASMKKLTQDTFKAITKWEKRTNDHGRDAAMLCFDFR